MLTSDGLGGKLVALHDAYQVYRVSHGTELRASIIPLMNNLLQATAGENCAIIRAFAGAFFNGILYVMKICSTIMSACPEK
tara:strand:+ start:123248 stop:123490 length:243 start_codon:yes stop_codon:yes gene_type:complete